MSEERVRGFLLLAGGCGLCVSAWLLEHEAFMPGIAGALLLAAALGWFRPKRGPRK